VAHVLVVERDGLVVVTHPGVPAVACVRCGRPTSMRWYDPVGRRLWPVHVLCLEVTRKGLEVAAA
jgi:hypothetical protein